MLSLVDLIYMAISELYILAYRKYVCIFEFTSCSIMTISNLVGTEFNVSMFEKKI
jgi:hypothetical protein